MYGLINLIERYIDSNLSPKEVYRDNSSKQGHWRPLIPGCASRLNEVALVTVYLGILIPFFPGGFDDKK
jgi:hypothetical protein